MLVPHLCAAPATLQPHSNYVFGFLSGLVQWFIVLYHLEVGLVNAEVIEVPLEPHTEVIEYPWNPRAQVTVLEFVSCHF